ncbi:MAG: histidinol dehydrogenase [Rhodospirillales bacterium]|nr:MAG: histidinol dehydrogenase [Rhodospirillales bacterium]
MPLRLDIRTRQFAERFAQVVAGRREPAANVEKVVAGVVDDVRQRGDAALIKYTRKFDKVELTPDRLRFSAREIDLAIADCDKNVVDALEMAARRIGSFHRRQLPQDLDYTDDVGIRLGYRWTPVSAAGLYVPGGTAAYPSSALMNALPAKIAGVERLVMVVPTPEGRVNPLVLAAARIAGVDEVYRIGGAQAIAALAYGTATIRPVDKIVGPGNAYVAAAKRRVFGIVGIDSIAGPSEVLIVADGSADADWIAVDLLAQAEHDAAAQSILITDDAAYADAVCAAVDRHLPTLPRRDIARRSWEDHGVVIIVEDLKADAPALIDRLAPEHLQLALEDPAEFADSVRHAGAVFLGRLVPEALGDYVAGPNHVLPTDRTARFSSGLGVIDFMKRTTFMGCGAGGLAAIGPAAVTLAEAEGLDAHARSVALRLNRRRTG